VKRDGSDDEPTDKDDATKQNSEITFGINLEKSAKIDENVMKIFSSYLDIVTAVGLLPLLLP